MSWSLWIKTTDEDGKPEYITAIDGCTYNLTPMWDKAVAFVDVTRDFDGKVCEDILEWLIRGLGDMIRNKSEYEALNPDNGWGDFDGFFRVYIDLVTLVAEHPKGVLEWSG
jgi:hypothetical protein